MNLRSEAPGDSPGPDRSLSRLRVLAYTSLGHFVNDGTTLFVPVVAALLTSHQEVDPLDLAFLFLIYYSSSSLLSLWVGRRADRSGRPALLMVGGMLLLGAGLVGFYAALALLSGPLTLAVSLGAGFVTGFGTAFYHPLGGTLLQERFQGAERGKALGINGAMGSTGRALYPVLFFLIGLVIASDASLLVFALFAGGAAGVILVASRQPGGLAPEAAPSGGRSVRSVLTRGVVLLAGVAFLRSVASQGIVAWLPTYLSLHPAGFGAPNLGLEVATIYVAGILGQPVFGVLVGHLDRRGLLAVSSVGTALATLGFLFSGGWEATACLLLIGFFTFSAFPLLMSLTPDYLPAGSSTLANSVVFGLATGGGSALGPTLVGLVAYRGYATLPLGLEVMVGVGLVSAAAVVWLPRPGTKSRMPMFG